MAGFTSCLLLLAKVSDLSSCELIFLWGNARFLLSLCSKLTGDLLVIGFSGSDGSIFFYFFVSFALDLAFSPFMHIFILLLIFKDICVSMLVCLQVCLKITWSKSINTYTEQRRDRYSNLSRGNVKYKIVVVVVVVQIKGMIGLEYERDLSKKYPATGNFLTRPLWQFLETNPVLSV